MTASLNIDQLKPYLLPIVTVVVLLVLVPLIIMPWLGDVQAGFAQMQTNQQKLNAMRAKADALEKLDAETNRQLLRQKVEPAIPSEADPAGLLGTLEQIAVSTGSKTKTVQYSQSGTKPTAAGEEAGQSVSTNFTIEGTYANIAFFISRAESVARVVSLNSMHIVPVSGSDNGDALLATFDVVAPYSPLPTDLGPAESPLPERTSAKTQALETVNKLQQASYAATAPAAITGKQNPF
jgi:Tfp pilus assembly protein PilO